MHIQCAKRALFDNFMLKAFEIIIINMFAEIQEMYYHKMDPRKVFWKLSRLSLLVSRLRTP